LNFAPIEVRTGHRGHKAGTAHLRHGWRATHPPLVRAAPASNHTSGWISSAAKTGGVRADLFFSIRTKK
jgi:hypothetical protein